MITITEWENKKIDLGDEIFEPVFERWEHGLYGSFNKLVAYKGVESGKLLHPDFKEVLESVQSQG